MSIKEWTIFDIGLFGGDKYQVLKVVAGWKQKRPLWIATVNPEFVMKTRKDALFKQILSRTDVNVIDGVALLWAREVLKRDTFLSRMWQGLKTGREVLRGAYDQKVVRGSELMIDLVMQIDREKGKIFLLGGFGQAAEKTGAFLRSKFLISDDKLKTCCGEPELSDKEVVKQIQEFRPDLLLVAYGMVKQEKWIAAHLSDLQKAGVRVVMGVGRSFDYYSGNLKRAPEKWRKMGLEWLYSLIQEPKRWRRQLALVRFVNAVIR